MTVYNDFDQLLEARTVDHKARIRFAQEWLRKNYGINTADAEWVDSLSNVHDHDNLEKHFGQIKIGTAFSMLVTQLVRVQEGWHLGVARKEGQQGVLLHPITEAASNDDEQKKLRLQLTQVVKNGKVKHDESSNPPVAVTSVPSLGEDIYRTKDAAADILDEPVSAPVTLDSTQKTKSVGIDLSAFM